jgi:PAS domain S-box-containing protein
MATSADLTSDSSEFFVADDLLQTLLDISLTAVNLLRPVYNVAGELADFELEYLNPVAQQMVSLPERPGGTVLSRFPDTQHNGLLAFYQRVFESGQADSYSIQYQADGLDNHFQVAARRSGPRLVVSFIDTASYQRMAAVQAEALAAAEQLVRQREAMYQVFEQTPASIAILRGPQHRFEYVNPGYQGLFPGRRLLGLDIAEALPETVDFGFVALLNQVYETSEPFFGTELPLQIHDAEGNLLPEAYYTFTYQAYQEEGITVGVSIFAFEVTEQVLARRRSEQMQAEALAAAEQLVRQRETMYQVFEQTPALLFIARGPDHRIDYVNPAYQALFPNRILIGKLTVEAIPEAAEHGFITLLDQVYTSGVPYFGNEVLSATQDAQGNPSERYLNFTYQAYQEQGVTVGVSSFAVDVSEQVLARKQVAAQQAQLAELFEQAPVAIGIFRGPDYVVEVANEPMCELWGRTPDEVLGRPLFEVLPEARGQGFKKLLDGATETGVAVAAQEVPAKLLRKGQLEEIFFNFVYQPLRDAEGHFSSIAAVATEVTEQVRARQQLEQLTEEFAAANVALSQANRQLTRTNQDLDSFVYAASHDLKQPVNNLSGLLEELRSTVTFADPAEEQLLVPLVEDSLRQLSATIEDLAALGQAQQAVAPVELVGLDELVQDVLTTLEPQVRAARARVTTDFAAHPTVTYARASLRTILFNLLSNSLKYAEPNRPARIHVSVWVQNNTPVLLVEDNGMGFDVERHQDELFHLFRRFHNHTEGTGVGLYLVNRIVQANGGHVEVESEVGEGTTFRIYLGAG